ncbi:MAG: tRNA (adenosine(37)-N6)-threonylcarbamoyltransferase complex transferase subunit TsaD, partial [Microcystis sp. M49629_WE12]|nr:tRNA (adenosine(37)-N6)-threonylcarbamoyltransferase complex transferase subunit TsaD [Microcystis sp. M49629_WE12]
MTIILAIETSCDETAVAIVNNNHVLSSVVSSQIDLHRLYGGVVPEMASRQHLETINF